MQFKIRVDAKDVINLIDTMSKHSAFAQSVAINRTVEEGLGVLRTRISRQFITRVASFDLPPQQLPPQNRATKERLFAEIRLGYDDVGGPKSIGGRRESIFAKFEAGGEKTGNPIPIAIPTKEIRPTPSALVPRAMYPVNLRLWARLDAGGKLLGPKARGTQRNQIIKRGQVKLKQADRTFELDPAHLRGLSPKAWGVWERIGPGEKDIRMIWAYRRRIPIPARLAMETSMTELINERFPINLFGAFEMALGYKPWAA